MEWKCVDCHMTFSNLSVYERHKTKFCDVGRKGGSAPKTIPENNNKIGYDPKSGTSTQPTQRDDWRKRAAQDIEQKLYLASLKQSPLLTEACSSRQAHARSVDVLGKNDSYMDKLKEITEIHNNSTKDLKTRSKRLQEEKAWIMEQMALAKVKDNNHKPVPSRSELERKEKELEEMKRRMTKLDNERLSRFPSFGGEVDERDFDETIIPTSKPFYLDKAVGTGTPTDLVGNSLSPKHHSSAVPVLQTLVDRADDLHSLSAKSFVSNEPKTQSALGLDPLDPSPYDPRAGFCIFWDYALGLDVKSTKCQLTMSLYMGDKAMTDTKPLPANECIILPLPHYTAALTGKASKIGRKTPFPKCLPNQAMYMVLELRLNNTDNSNPEEMQTVGWTKIDLFDFKNRVVSGRWKVPVRVLPIQPGLSQQQLNRVDQLGNAEIYFRIANSRDMKNEEQFPVQPQNSYLYKFLQEGYGRLLEGQNSPSFQQVPSVCLTDHDEALHNISKMSPGQSLWGQQDQMEVQSLYSRRSVHSNISGEEEYVGIQVDKVTHAQGFEGTVKVSVIGPDGEVLKSSDGTPVLFKTDPSKNTFLTGITAFGLDEHEFKGVKWNTKTVVLVELFNEQATPPSRNSRRTKPSIFGWTTMPLADLPRPFSTETSLQASRVNTAVSGVEPMLHTGYHELPLFQPPKPQLNKIPLNKDTYPPTWNKMMNSSVTIFIYDQSLPSAIQPAPIPRYTEEDHVNEDLFIEKRQSEVTNTAYEDGDGFDLYIDGARFLPSTVAAVKVVGGVLDRQFKRYEEDIVTLSQLDSYTVFPEFDYHAEFRHVPNMCPSATLYLRVYVVDTVTKQQAPLGCTALPIFLEKGSLTQATNEHRPNQVALNEGVHQIRLYAGNIRMRETLDRGDILSVTALDKLSKLSCSSLLVRIVRVPNHPNGRPKKRSDFQEKDWYKEGLLVPKPEYKTGVYFSSTCIPTLGEIQIFHDLFRRGNVKVRDAIKTVSENNESLTTDGAIINHIKTLFAKTENEPPDFNSNFLVPFNPKHGFKLSVDSAQNLPWSGLTVVSYCFLPPMAYFEGSRKDAMYFVYHLNFDTQQKRPEWKDLIKQHPMREFHPFLMIVFQLHVFEYNAEQEKLNLSKQAWCVLQLLQGLYCLNVAYQLPLYDGQPPKNLLDEMSKDLARNVLRDARQSKQVQVLEGSSLFVRVCDGRRREEVTAKEAMAHPLPKVRRASYIEVEKSHPLKELLPLGVSEDKMTRLLRKALEDVTRAHLKEPVTRKDSTASLPPSTSPQTPSQAPRLSTGRPVTNTTDY